ncbi:hypothetical protein GCM10010082_25690 [Kushneria pakistanensis]|uniref:Uncharacterized protein n=1 Tax=Kushneria pakistanensis TaxID=1508770 RepID=A0ABQ3FN45_9GAMM|nr:hypothetical protein GCM10010082_25690 [Kushneria pakistanensis]
MRVTTSHDQTPSPDGDDAINGVSRDRKTSRANNDALTLASGFHNVKESTFLPLDVNAIKATH